MSLRPLLMTSSFAPHIGGVERVVEELAQQLLARGSTPIVITNRWPKTLSRRDVIDGVEVRREVFRVPGLAVRQLGGWALTGVEIRRRLIASARRHNATLVNLHCVSGNAAYALAVCKALDLPLVVSLHGELTGDATGVYQRSAYLRRQWRRVLDRAEIVTAPSEYALSTAEKAYGKPFGDRGVIARNGVNVQLLRGSQDPAINPTDSRRGVLSVGRLVHIKGFDLLLKAWRSLPQSIQSEHPLVIAGDGPERGNLEHYARRMQLSHVAFAGALNNASVAECMRRAAVVVVPSREESLGLVALEAMAAGAPVIASRAGGLPEIVRPGETGLLVPPEDPDSLAKALLQVLTQPERTQALTKSAGQLAGRLTWNAYADLMIEVFERVGKR